MGVSLTFKKQLRMLSIKIDRAGTMVESLNPGRCMKCKCKKKAKVKCWEYWLCKRHSLWLFRIQMSMDYDTNQAVRMVWFGCKYVRKVGRVWLNNMYPIGVKRDYLEKRKVKG